MQIFETALYFVDRSLSLLQSFDDIKIHDDFCESTGEPTDKSGYFLDLKWNIFWEEQNLRIDENG